MATAAIVIDSSLNVWFTTLMNVPIDTISRLSVALDDLERAAADNVDRSLAIQDRLAWLRRGLEDGTSLAQLVETEEQPRVVELITTNMVALETFGAEFRAAEAHALRAEGLTIARIAELFGVTRQRISALLRQRPE